MLRHPARESIQRQETRQIVVRFAAEAIQSNKRM
jgi:hypothetical protein